MVRIGLLNSLSFLDRYLAVWILLAMITGVLIGVYRVGPGDILHEPILIPS